MSLFARRLASVVIGTGVALGLGCGDSGTKGDGDGSDGGDDGTGPGCPVGTEGCPCTSGGACDPGLECRSNICVEPGGSGGDDGGSTSDTSGATATGGSSDGSSADSGSGTSGSSTGPTSSGSSTGSTSSSDDGGSTSGTTMSTGSTSSSDGGSTSGSGGSSTDSATSSTGSDTGTNGTGSCAPPAHAPCDTTTDPYRALGVGCPGEHPVTTTSSGSAAAIGARTGFGTGTTFDPREGSRYAVIGSGYVSELDSEAPMGDSQLSPTYCNDDLGVLDPGATLPAPLDTSAVGTGGTACLDTPALVGTGDCSASIEAQFTAGGTANDYADLRIDTNVPAGARSFSVDHAFLSAEYPYYFGTNYNDMFVIWLESDDWTGNIAFDASNVAMSLNSSFFTIRDDSATLPELAGTCMKGHGATPWLTSVAGVTPGTSITVVFAIFDLTDAIIDSYAFIDNFAWGCDHTLPPETAVAG